MNQSNHNIAPIAYHLFSINKDIDKTQGVTLINGLFFMLTARYPIDMTTLKLEGHTLGEKHKNFNKLVRDTIADKQFTLTDINFDDSDLQNLLKIAAACKTKNVGYIIKVLKCDDMLYVSKAIKQSTWLVTEQEYAHIVNPEYLYTQLFPHMLTKAINKLLLHIRLHLKDEKRLEAFYNYLKDLHNDASKWLLNCSVPFIENVIQNERNISVQLYKRLCKRSVIFLKYYSKVKLVFGGDVCGWCPLKAVLFFLKSDTEEFLDFLDTVPSNLLPDMAKQHTEIVMQNYPNKILDNFEKYMFHVDMSIVAKYMEKEEIEAFLHNHLKSDNVRSFLFDYVTLKHFLKKAFVTKEERFEFLKKILCPNAADCMPSCSINAYHWYHYAPFDVAFVELKKLIRAESSPAERCAMLSILITCARNNPEHTKTLLQHYYDKHRNEPFKFKNQFVNNVITQMTTHEFDSETWNILDKLFYSLEVYAESDKNVQMCVKSIILYKCLHNEDIPAVVHKKFTFDTFNKIQSKLNEEQKEKIFSYLFQSVSAKIQGKNIQDDSNFYDAIILLINALNLLIDWKKDLKEHAFLLDKIREFTKLKSCDESKMKEISSLFNLKKSWRQHMFEESIAMCRNEEVCLNALKHDPDMLLRHVEVMDALRNNPAVYLRRLLAKLRVYWTDTLAKQWIDKYLKSLNNTRGHKAILKGLLVLLPQKQLIDIAKKYVPVDPNIEWNDQLDQIKLNIRKNIASNLYIARPMVPFEVLLWYAKGDYLQYVVPSLNAISYNLSKIQGRDEIPKLLEVSVSLQKYGIHLAFLQQNFSELKLAFLDVWGISKDPLAQTYLFTYTYNLLCKVKKPTVAKELWAILSMFIDSLTEEENKLIFSKLGQVRKLHKSVQGQFYMKSYEFLSKLPPKANCDGHLKKLIGFAPNIMDLLDADFVACKLLSPIEEKITRPESRFIKIMTAFILHGKSEKEQCERFRNVVAPGLEHAFKSWDMVKDDQYIIRDNFNLLLKALTLGFKKFFTMKNNVIPVKLFADIKTLIEQKLSISENYVIFTSWKLTTEYVKLVAEEKDMLCDPKIDNFPRSDFERYKIPEDAENVWEALHIKVSPKFGPIIVKHLKEDTVQYFPTICWLFSEAMYNLFTNLKFQRNVMEMETLKYMVLNEDFIPSYIVVCDTLPKYSDDEDQKKRDEVRKMLSAHPSKEVKMHYQRAFGGIPDTLTD